MELNLESQWYDQKTYQQGLLLQSEKFAEVKASSKLSLIGLEHSEVLTLGIRSHSDTSLLSLSENFEIVKTKRGGHATIHNPGQLVIYPVVPLREMDLGVRDFVCLLIKTSKEFFKAYGVETFEKSEPGLFTEKGKIALFGIQVSRGITQHGLSININNDLQCFEKIPVCDVKGESMDRLSHYKSDLNLETCFDQWVEIFKTKI